MSQFTVTVTNKGPNKSPNTVLQFSDLTGIDIQTTSATKGEYTSGYWVIGDMQPETEETLAVEYQTGEKKIIQATVHSGVPDLNSSNNTVDIAIGEDEPVELVCEYQPELFGGGEPSFFNIMTGESDVVDGEMVFEYHPDYDPVGQFLGPSPPWMESFSLSVMDTGDGSFTIDGALIVRRNEIIGYPSDGAPPYLEMYATDQDKEDGFAVAYLDHEHTENQAQYVDIRFALSLEIPIEDFLNQKFCVGFGFIAPS